MTLLERWKSFDVDSPDAGGLRPPGGEAHLVAFVAAPGARSDGWAPRAAVEIARGWGAEGSRVVLCDAGFEEPTLHDAAGLDNLEGISDALLFGTSFQRLGQPLSDGLFLATAGTAVPDGEALRAHPRWRDFARGFSDAGALQVIYVPAEAPGADAILELCQGVVVLAERSEVDSVPVPPNLTVLAVAGPESPAPPALGPVGEDRADDPSLEPDAPLEAPGVEPAAGQPEEAEPGAVTAGFAEAALPEVLDDERSLAEGESSEDPFTEAEGDEDPPEAVEEAHDPRSVFEDHEEALPGTEEFESIGSVDPAPEFESGTVDADSPIPSEEGTAAFSGTPPEEEEEGAEPSESREAGSEVFGESGGAPDAEATPAASSPTEKRPKPKQPERKSGRTSVALLGLFAVVLAVLLAAWMGLVEIPGITPAPDGSVDEVDAAELAPGAPNDPGVAATDVSGSGEPEAPVEAGEARSEPPEARGAAAPGENPVAAYVLTLGSFEDLASAQARARANRRAYPEVDFVVAPVEVDQRPWFRLLAGPAADLDDLSLVRERLTGSPTGGPGDWIVRRAGLAYLVAAPRSPDLAQRRVQALASAGIPAHILQFRREDGVSEFRVYVGAYADAAEAGYMGRILEENNIDDARLTERRGIQP